MNKRQKKKFDSKVLWPVVDESGLLTMSPEERDDAYEEYRRFARRYCRFFHYRDKSNRTLYRYAYPVKGVCSEPVTFAYFSRKQSYDVISCIQHVHKVGMDVLKKIEEMAGIKVISFDQASEYARLENVGRCNEEG